ncbi:hypothetical protein EBR57_06755, partial [bacterium]|nr:hypothetical protein [bacterium]
TSIKPAVQAELVEMIATGSSQIAELYRSHSAMTDVATQFDAAQKWVEAIQGNTINPIMLLRQGRAGQQLNETTEKLDLTVTGYADMSMRKAGDVLKNGLESSDLSPESWALAREAAATMILDAAKRISVLQENLRVGHGENRLEKLEKMASDRINDRMTEFALAIRAIDLPAGNPTDATRTEALLAIRDAVEDVVRPYQELGAILDAAAVRPILPGSYAQTLRAMNIDASQQIQDIKDRGHDLKARSMTQAERVGASLLQGLTEARRDPSMVTVPTNESMVVLHKMTKALGESAVAVVPGELRARLQQADDDSVPDVIIELNRIIDQGLIRPMRLAAMQEQMQERQRYTAAYTGDTKVSVNSDFSSLDRKLLTDGPQAMVELNKRANGVLRHVVELSSSGDFGSINQLLGNIRRTGGTAGDLVIQVVAYEVRRLGKQQQFETYLKSSDARTEQFVKTLSEDKKAQQEAKAKFAESLRRDEAPTDADGAPLTLLGDTQVHDVQASFDRNEALAAVAVQLNADPKKLEGILSDPSGATKLAQLLAQGVALNLPGAHRILEQLLQKESQGIINKLGVYLGGAIREIDEKAGGPSGIAEEVKRVLESAIKETEKKEKGSVADQSNKKDGFIVSIKMGYQGDRKLVGLSRQDRVTTTSKAMVTGGAAAIDKTRADFQNFAKVDPNGAAVLIKDLHTVNPNHANTLLEGMMKNLDSAALPGLSQALATVSVDADISPQTKSFVDTLKATIDQQLAEDLGKQGTTLSHGLVTAALVGGRTEFTAEVTARATDLKNAGIAGHMFKLITEMATKGVLTKDQLAEFSAGIDALPVDQQLNARELAHFAMAKADPNQFLMSHVAAGTRSDNSTLVANDTMRP